MGYVKTEKAYYSDDGLRFSSQEEMERHESRVRVIGLVNVLVEQLDLSDYPSERARKAARTRVQNGGLMMAEFLHDEGLLKPEAYELGK